MIDVYALDTHFFSASEEPIHVEPFLRSLLSERGVPQDAEIVKNKYGKPYLKDYPKVCFNGSHSGDFLVCAFSDRPVGVDVQVIDMKKNTKAIAKRFMTENEAYFLEKLDQESAKKAFYRLWAQKESYMKYRGQGFALALNAFEIKEQKGTYEIFSAAERVAGVFLSTLKLDGNYELWVCGEEKDIRLRIRKPQGL